MKALQAALTSDNVSILEFPKVKSLNHNQMTFFFTENMKSAKAAVDKEVSQTVQVDEESDGSRKRTKNKRLEGYETNHGMS